jgi:hypothetical protein
MATFVPTESARFGRCRTSWIPDRLCPASRQSTVRAGREVQGWECNGTVQPVCGGKCARRGRGHAQPACNTAQRRPSAAALALPGKALGVGVEVGENPVPHNILQGCLKYQGDKGLRHKHSRKRRSFGAATSSTKEGVVAQGLTSPLQIVAQHRADQGPVSWAETASRPCMSALAFASRIRYRAARGPAPQAIQFLTNTGPCGSLGRVARTRFAA